MTSAVGNHQFKLPPIIDDRVCILSSCELTVKTTVNHFYGGVKFDKEELAQNFANAVNKELDRCYTQEHPNHRLTVSTNKEDGYSRRIVFEAIEVLLKTRNKEEIEHAIETGQFPATSVKDFAAFVKDRHPDLIEIKPHCVVKNMHPDLVTQKTKNSSSNIYMRHEKELNVLWKRANNSSAANLEELRQTANGLHRDLTAATNNYLRGSSMQIPENSSFISKAIIVLGDTREIPGIAEYSSISAFGMYLADLYKKALAADQAYSTTQ